MNQEQIIDRDGNIIREGMTAVSGGDNWVVGGVCPAKINGFVRLDRTREDGRKESRIIGRKRLCCVHLIGFRNF